MYKSLSLSLLCILGTYWSGTAQLTTFGYTGLPATYTVPPGVYSITFDVKGASGGQAGPAVTLGGPTTPGCGGEVTGVMSVTPGQVLNIRVGQVGANGAGLVPAAGGYPAGGSAAIFTGPPLAGGGGGGRSDIFAGTTAMVIAGGGGGAGYNPYCPVGNQPGGNGGGLAGADGITCTASIASYGAGYSATNAGGGSTVGGAGGSITGFGFTPGTNGASLAGGDNVSGGGIGGGGGDGYFGGGGGSGMGGGGGSSYTDPSISSFVHTQGSNCGTGYVTICALPNPGLITGPTSVCAGSTITLTNPTATGTGRWTSSSSTIANIGSTTGVVTGGTVLFPQTPSITYTSSVACGSDSTTILLTVDPSPAPITGPGAVCLFSSYALNSITLGDATTGGVWASDATATAVVDPVGDVQGHLVGTDTITYTLTYPLNTCFAFKVITVNPVPGPIVSAFTPPAVCDSMTATETDPLGPPLGIWTSNDPSVISIDPSTGVATGVGGGGANIIYTAPNGCSSYVFMVDHSKPSNLATAFGINQLCQGDSLGIAESKTGGTWSVSVPDGVIHLASGLFGEAGSSRFIASTTSYGPTVISYTISGCPAVTLPMTVNPTPAPIAGVFALCSGALDTLTDLTPGGLWSTSSSGIAAVDSTTGIVTPNPAAIGSSATIFYKVTSTGCFTLVPVNISLGSNSIIGPDSVCQGASINLADSSAGGTWSSTDLAIAQVIATTGVTRGISAGVVNISYTLTSGCYAVKNFTVSPLVPAIISVTQSPSDSVCAGIPITLTATSINSGIAPIYAWTKFETDSLLRDTATTSDTSIYIDDSARHGDVIIIKMTVSGICAVSNVVYDTVPLNIYPTVLPVITISTPSATRAPYLGYTITLFAAVDHGGTSPTYQWYENRLPIPGATASTYATNVFANDTFYCIVSGNPICSLDSTAVALDTSNRISFDVTYLGVNSTQNKVNNFSLFPNPNNGTFTLSGIVDAAINEDVSFEVSDILGHTVYTGKTTPQNGVIQTQVKLDNLSEGTYLLRVNSGNSNEVFHFVVDK